MLTFILGVIDQINAMINTLDQRIETYMTNLEESIGLLHTIPGVSYHIAMGIIAEIGTTMETFPTHKHLASWTGICPGSNESAGKKRSSKVTHGNKYLKTILVEAAWAARKNSHPKPGWLFSIEYCGSIARIISNFAQFLLDSKQLVVFCHSV